VSFQRGVRACIAEAGLDTSKGLHKQDHGRLHQCYTEVRTAERPRILVQLLMGPNPQAKKRFPYLERFEGHWPAEEFLKQTLRDRRKYATRLALKAAEKAAEEDEDEDEEGDGIANGLDGDDDDDESAVLRDGQVA
jgi:hypothetical protein